jgi:hypothetical protein
VGWSSTSYLKRPLTFTGCHKCLLEFFLFLYVRVIYLMYEGIIASAFTTVRAKAPKLFQVFWDLLMLHIYTVGNGTTLVMDPIWWPVQQLMRTQLNLCPVLFPVTPQKVHVTRMSCCCIAHVHVPVLRDCW